MIYVNNIPCTVGKMCSNTFYLCIGQLGFTLYMLSLVCPRGKYAYSIKSVEKRDIKRNLRLADVCFAIASTFTIDQGPQNSCREDSKKAWTFLPLRYLAF